MDKVQTGDRREEQELHDKQRDLELKIFHQHHKSKAIRRQTARELCRVYTQREQCLRRELDEHRWLLWLHIAPSIWWIHRKRLRLERQYPPITSR